MDLKALLVTLDDSIVPAVDDTLASLDHEHDRATNQHDARCLVRTNNYSYVLLDLEIPTRKTGKAAERVHGYHLLEDILRIKGRGQLAVIIVDGEARCINYVVKYLENGATDFISKPFDRRTLSKIIRRALRRRQANGPIGPSVELPASRKPRPFTGGDLVLYPHHAELLGIKIVADTGPGYSLKILHELRPVRPGVPVFRSLEELKFSTGAVCDGTITGAIRTIRRNSDTRLRKYLGIQCDKQDVVARSEQGYHYADWINVILAGEDADPACVPACDTAVPAPVPADPARVPVHVPEQDTADPARDPASAGTGCGRTVRQRWAIDQMSRGVEFQRRMLEKKFGIGEKTAKRDMAGLTRGDKAEFVRLGRGGYYRLRDVEPPSSTGQVEQGTGR